MKSIVFCTSFCRNERDWNARNQRWLDHHRQLPFSDARLILIDDGSFYLPEADRIPSVSAAEDLSQNDARELIVHFGNRLGRSATVSYPGWWRSFLHSVCVARAVGARKIIHVESDSFILSRRLLDHIEQIDRGWTAFWTPHYGMPETALQVICEDQFERMEALRRRDVREFEGLQAEDILPYTNVIRDFIGDRYGELRIDLLERGPLRAGKFKKMKFFRKDRFRARIPADADYAVQVTPDQQIWLPRP